LAVRNRTSLLTIWPPLPSTTPRGLDVLTVSRTSTLSTVPVVSTPALLLPPPPGTATSMPDTVEALEPITFRTVRFDGLAANTDSEEPKGPRSRPPLPWMCTASGLL
jgi:hypothetical protein